MNYILAGKVLTAVRPWFFGASLMALMKREEVSPLSRWGTRYGDFPQARMPPNLSRSRRILMTVPTRGRHSIRSRIYLPRHSPPLGSTSHHHPDLSETRLLQRLQRG